MAQACFETGAQSLCGETEENNRNFDRNSDRGPPEYEANHDITISRYYNVLILRVPLYVRISASVCSSFSNYVPFPVLIPSWLKRVYGRAARLLDLGTDYSRGRFLAHATTMRKNLANMSHRPEYAQPRLSALVFFWTSLGLECSITTDLNPMQKTIHVWNYCGLMLSNSSVSAHVTCIGTRKRNRKKKLLSGLRYLMKNVPRFEMLETNLRI